MKIKKTLKKTIVTSKVGSKSALKPYPPPRAKKSIATDNTTSRPTRKPKPNPKK